jgi:hypothetical protein
MISKPQARESAFAWIALFTSIGTLLCCALPALLVTLGAGAVLAGLVTAVPQIVALSEHKGTVFGIAGAVLLAGGLLRHLNRHAPCPVDPDQAVACARLRRWGGLVLYAATAIYVVGFFFAFLAGQVFA